MLRLLILLMAFVIHPALYSFNSIGLSLGPDFGVRGSKSTSFLMNMDWNPHENLGTRFFVGVDGNLWLGTAMSFIYQTKDRFSTRFNWRAYISIPFLLKIQHNDNLAMTGFTLGNSLGCSIDEKRRWYLFITPFEFMFFPLTWRMYPSSSFEKALNVYVTANVGIRLRI